MGLYTTTRVLWIDILRAVAIIGMIAFHLLWDLQQFKVLDIDIFSLNMLFFRDGIVAIFLFLVGYSLQLSFSHFIVRKFVKRVFLLFIVSLSISISSYFIYPSHWIYFGIIHFILLSTIIGVLFVNRAILSFFVAIVVFALSYFGFGFRWLKLLLIKEFQLPQVTYDLLTFTPWFGVVLIGISSFSVLKNFDIIRFKYAGVIEYISKHSLIIYLIHQPILFGGFYIYRELI
jgi:uncharacterized membrane protein